MSTSPGSSAGASPACPRLGQPRRWQLQSRQRAASPMPPPRRAGAIGPRWRGAPPAAAPASRRRSAARPRHGITSRRPMPWHDRRVVRDAPARLSAVAGYGDTAAFRRLPPVDRPRRRRQAPPRLPVTHPRSPSPAAAPLAPRSATAPSCGLSVAADRVALRCLRVVCKSLSRGRRRSGRPRRSWSGPSSPCPACRRRRHRRPRRRVRRTPGTCDRRPRRHARCRWPPVPRGTGS